MVEQTHGVDWTPLPVPWAVQAPDRIPKQRYYDPEFYALENELFWPRVWQMACRLEEIPNPGDFVEYEILDQSIIVVRVDANTVRAYYNSCRHRGDEARRGPRDRQRELRLPVPRLVLGPRRQEHVRVAPRAVRRSQPRRRRPRAGTRCRCETVGRVRVDQPRRRRAAAASIASSRSPPSTTSGRSERFGPSGGSRACCR